MVLVKINDNIDKGKIKIKGHFWIPIVSWEKQYNNKKHCLPECRSFDSNFCNKHSQNLRLNSCHSSTQWQIIWLNFGLSILDSV